MSRSDRGGSASSWKPRAPGVLNRGQAPARSSEPTGKAKLRHELRTRRAETPADLVAGWSAALCARVAAFDTWRSAETVHLFIGALPGEVRTETLLQHAFAEGKTVICPRALPRGQLAHHRVTALADLTPARFGLLEPGATSPLADPTAADLVLVPGLGFDSSGARIGMGGGYYDRFLTSLDCVRLGLTFEWQLLTHVPMQAHDQRVDAIVTELRVIEAARGEE